VINGIIISTFGDGKSMCNLVFFHPLLPTASITVFSMDVLP
jgi:hypothetical protein